MTTETELRDRLHSAAWRVGTDGDDVAAADAVISRRRTERRHRAAGGAATIVLLVVAVLVSVLDPWWSTGQAPARPAAPVRTTTVPAPTVDSHPGEQWVPRTRGSLAGDQLFLGQVRARPWPGAGNPPAANARSVVFAGDIGGTRWVLVSGPVDGRRTGQWFAGPAGAAAGVLADEGLVDLQPGLPVGHVHLDTGGASLLVLSMPGDEVQVSPAVVVAADGTARRDYTAVPSTDGVAVVHETGAFAGSAVRFRVLRDGSSVGAGPSGSTFVVPDDLGDAADQAPLRPSSGAALRATVMNALEPVLAATGLGPADVHPVLVWTGPIPLQGGGARAQAVVLALTMPSGAVVTTTAFGSEDGTMPSGTCGSTVHPAGTALADLVVVTSCDTTRRTGGHLSFVVSAPSAYDRVALRMSDGSTATQAPLVDGAALVEDPGAIATAVVSGPGTSPVQVTPPSSNHDPFDVG